MPLPDFTSTTLFPPFVSLPLESDAPGQSSSPSPSSTDLPSYAESNPPPSSSSHPTSPTPQTAPPPSYSSTTTTSTHFLLAQVKQNMTITKPTLVVTDRQGTDFAITFEDRGVDLRPVKAGWTVVVPGAARVAPSAEGKRGFVRVPQGRGTGVHYLPASLGRVFEVGAQLNEVEARQGGRDGDGDGDGAAEAEECVSCGATEGEGGGKLMRCTGCKWVRYCNKACQKKDWGEGGHKNDCKVFKAMAITWGS
ncbi:hypothetical protein SODALDRAFT_330949 [Sodiomyces alkalinus F11]|uniref:MYND-type domain-containing protein n=1 Tax=Sodiomyces alkalinus (strain CBS 110278 / VKM F-3762 / F11) TaxID=1314773 RepID=A0A3N2Q3I4_SODAK|nr:hypothetical protein SODALDRAFT_330949 [Sodiomyces alkalinus F11]ROT41228.1 hypothetical protein SODALDRAFT_330949 [Sodiomyces alkalinus F11]